MIDLTANDLCLAVPAKTIINIDTVKQESQINLLGTQLIIPDTAEEFGFSDGSEAAGSDAGSDVEAELDIDENIFLAKRMTNAIETPVEDEEPSVVKVNFTAINSYLSLILHFAIVERTCHSPSTDQSK